MNQKKCPKCGENNPPEAVMCWACYTPLTGAAPVPAGVAVPRGPGGPPGAGAATATSDAGGAGGIQPWMYAVGGVVLLIILVIGAKVLMGGGDEAVANSPGDTSGSVMPPVTGSSPPVGGTMGKIGSLPPPPSNSSSSGPGSTTTQQTPYTIGALPNPQASVGVVGIVPNQAVSSTQAASIAKFAVSQFANVDHWGAVEVFVFQDQQSNQVFKDFQTSRRNTSLTADDFNSPDLTNLWPQTMAVYVAYRGGKERVVKPGSGNWYEPLIATQ